MKIIKFFFFVFVFTANINAQNYQLIWSDEFDGTEINNSNWTHETGGHGWGNNEWQYYTNRLDNSFVEGGILTIRALKENYQGKNYTSARMITKGKKFWRYGKIEARIKLPYGQGIWPAFWMMGENISSVGWPACGELDIMEMIGGDNRENTIYGTAHWDDNGHASYGGNYTLGNSDFSQDFHLFTAEWKPNEIIWYVDNQRYVSIDITPPQLNEFQKEFFILFNLAIGGNWPGYPNSETVFPQEMKIDYVRVYQDVANVPSVTLTSPANNSQFIEYSTINLETSIELSSGSIKNVEFYQGSRLIGQTDVAPYKIKWKNVSAGCYEISAKAFTKEGYDGTSEIVNVKVGEDCVPAPYSGKPVQIPGNIEVENYNLGGSGISFSDSDVINNGGSYRNDQVDIQTCSDIGGGFNLGWIEANEWLNYFIEVEKTADYSFVFRTSSTSSGGKLNVEIDGTDVTGTVSINSTGGWQNWGNVEANNIALSAGKHLLKLKFSAGGFNLNRIEIYEPGTLSSINLIAPNGGEKLEPNSIYEILWHSLKTDNVKIGYSTDGGATWSFVSNGTTAEFGVYRWLIPEVSSENCKIMVINADDFSVSDLSDLPFSISNLNSVNEGLDELTFFLEQNYPNPFNPETIIRWQTPESSWQTLKVYDVLGNEVATLANKFIKAGIHQAKFNANGLSSGIYFYRLSSNGKIISKKMLLLQ